MQSKLATPVVVPSGKGGGSYGSSLGGERDAKKGAGKDGKGADGQARKKRVKSTNCDPIKKILKVNNRSFALQKKMNQLLIKILQRYELDKPILMQDKLDVIWDKNEETARVESAAREKPAGDPEEEFN